MIFLLLLLFVQDGYAKFTCKMNLNRNRIVYGCPDIQETLDLVNKFREKHNVLPLEWDTELENGSNEYAKYRGDCAKEHSPDAFNKYSENLYCIGGYPITNASCSTAINVWYSEVSYYDFNNKKPFTTIALKKDVGHFTAMVWKNTKKIGCGARRDNNYPIKVLPGINGFVLSVVCRFYPPGNIASDSAFVENVLPP